MHAGEPCFIDFGGGPPMRGGTQGLQLFAGFFSRYPFRILLIQRLTGETSFLVREAALETLQIPSNPAMALALV